VSDHENIVALAGDWHGDSAWANARLQSLGERAIKIVLHLGDFGIWPGPTGVRYLRTIEAVCARYELALFVTPGNHDDWGRLISMWEHPKHRSEDGLPRPLYLTDHVAVLPRGYRWTWGGRSFVSLGGAPSVDFESRSRGRDWWPEEQIARSDVDRTVAGGYADVMLTHDAPGPPWATPQIEAILSSNPMGWSAPALDYAAVGRALVTEAFLGVRPRFLAHGHYHCSDEASMRLPGADYETTVRSLGMQGQGGNIRLLDLGSLVDVATT
jgi:hypothetical protein